jgi:Tat protein translocase TatB subunit
MEFMGIGPLELLLILVIALIVFGPNRLPEIAAQIGKFVHNMRQMSFEFTRQLNKELESSKRDIAKAADEVKAITKAVNPLAAEENKESPRAANLPTEDKNQKPESNPPPPT